MEDALAKIRPHTSSNLPHQKTPANLLSAIESTFQEQKTEASSTAYFAALLTTIDGTIQRKDLGLGDADILPAELYLLALVSPFVSPPVIRTNLDTLLSLTAPLFPSLTQHAPALKSQLSLYRAIFLALDRSQLEVQGIRQAFASILQLCLDQRPKVRKKASEVVKNVLAVPPLPLLRHPYAERVAIWTKASLEDQSQNPLSRSKSKASDGTESAIHLVSFLRQVIKHLPSSFFADIINLLLRLPRLGNPFLSQSTYIALSEVLEQGDEEDVSLTNDQICAVLETILSAAPTKFETNLSAPWVTVAANALVAFSQIDNEACTKDVGSVWKAVWPFLESTDTQTRRATVDSLGLISTCVTPRLIQAGVTNKKSTVSSIVDQVEKGLNSLALAHSVPEVLAVIAHLISNLEDKNHDVAEPLLLPLIKQIGELRTKKGFEYREAVDATLAAAMRAFGPHVILQALPLNLEPSDREAGLEPRAFLLPLLSQPHPSPLSHFVSYFVPLSERMFNLQQKAETEGRQSEAKVWSVLIAQVWSGFASYCHGSVDLPDAITPQFSQLMSQLLYGQPDMRPAVLKGLKVMVESNVALQKADDEERPSNAISAEQAAQNIDFVKGQAESWLAVLFNVFSSVGRENRNMVGDVISAWASIARNDDIRKAYSKVVNLFKTNLSKALSASQGTSEDNRVTMAQDLLLLLIPNFSSEDAQKLFDLVLSPTVLTSKDNGIQKRGYKMLAKLAESSSFAIDTTSVFQKLDQLSDGFLPAAKRDRFAFITELVLSIPSDSLHLIVSLIPEAVLGTKEPSDKARSAAFDLLIAMGKRMQAGGIVNRSRIDGMDEDGIESTASIEEFMTMLAGGLAGASPHMISGTVTAISRLVFEFKDDISPQMREEIFTTHLVFVSSANREIVKSVLGFIKLSIHTLPTDIIRPHLKELVPALLGWSHDHKNHFKVKVRHIFERMLRRFSWDEVYSCAGDNEAAKVLTNIKKRKERAKRRKAERADADDDEEPAPRATAGDAFEDVLYGSESELEDSDNDQPRASAKASVKARAKTGPRLRLDGDNPIDLLKGASSQITSGKGDKRRKPGQEAARFKTDDDTGKMIIDEEDPEVEGPAEGEQIEGMTYKESLTSVDGFTRGQRGTVKFNKDTKKRRRENTDLDEDAEMADADSLKTKQASKQKQRKLGSEFKAKRAGGDVKKGGVDPYAYVHLSQAAKKGNKKNRIGVAAK